MEQKIKKLSIFITIISLLIILFFFPVIVIIVRQFREIKKIEQSCKVDYSKVKITQDDRNSIGIVLANIILANMDYKSLSKDVSEIVLKEIDYKVLKELLNKDSLIYWEMKNPTFILCDTLTNDEIFNLMIDKVISLKK